MGNNKYNSRAATILNNRCSAMGLTEGRNGSASSAVVHTGASQCQEKQGKPSEKRREATAHTAYSEYAMPVHTETIIFAKLEKGKGSDRLWCHQIHGFLGGAGRSGTHGCTTSRCCAYSLDRTKKTWRKYKRKKQSEGEVAFKVNAGGLASDCKINCLNTTRVPILLSVQRLSQRGAIFDFSTATAVFRNLIHQFGVQMEKGTDGHQYLSLLDDLLSRPILDKGQLEGFQAAAQVSKSLNK